MPNIHRTLGAWCALAAGGGALVLCGGAAAKDHPENGRPNDVCPAIEALSASPADVLLGGSTTLRVRAHDCAAGPRLGHPALSYDWSSSSGTLAGDFTTTSATFTCTAPGSATVTVTARNGETSCHVSKAVTVSCSPDASSTFYTTKTPYQPHQDPRSYEPAPSGFSTVFTQLVARHGSRGLSSVKYDAAAYNMWKQAEADGALTQLGQSLGPDIMRLMKANALLGFGVAGIGTPGYGNLTQVGIREQQQLAKRLLQRQSRYFAELAPSHGHASAARSLLVLSSGVDRAVDSAAFFSQSLVEGNAALAALVTQPPAPAGYPAGAPVAQPAGTNRFLLYFHKLAAKTDLVTDPNDPYYTTYQASLAFQAYAKDAGLAAKVEQVLDAPEGLAAAHGLLSKLFSEDFISKIDDHSYSFDNSGTYSFVSDDGKYSASVSGDGKTTVHSLTDAAAMLYNLYIIAPAMQGEAAVDFARYIAPDQARALAYLQDAQDFYAMGPGLREDNPITYQLAVALENDFFSEVDAIAKGDLSHAAKLRFTHAEIIVPFASRLGLAGVFAPVPEADTYRYASNPWRGELVSPMAANVQWDVYRNRAGTLLVKMLYNERETPFKPACDSARVRPGSFYYVYDKLAACYGHAVAPQH